MIVLCAEGEEYNHLDCRGSSILKFVYKIKILSIAEIPQDKKKSLDIQDSLAVRRGLEPLTPCVTGTYSNQLN